MVQEKISYEEIRSKKELQYGTEFRDWIWILVKQYKDRTHFLFELLQNAEDAKATDVKLWLHKNQLIIEHNGILFSKDDVVSITKVAKSTKSGANSGNIGKFGIGFKSVYAYAATPRIYSGDYAFEIRDFIYPYEIDPVVLMNNWTRIVIPFNNGEISEQKAFEEIRRALNEQISSNTLLFLNNIESLEISIDGMKDMITISKEERERSGVFGNVLDVSLMYQRGVKQREEEYLLFTDCEEEAIKLAFKVNGKELEPVQNTNIYTFFPTDKESHQSFYIHAPFETTPARDNIVEDSERNRHFVENICEGLGVAFCWMRDNGYLSISGLNATYPIYEYPRETIFYEIYRSAVRIIGSDEKLIPTNQTGVFKNRSEILMPDNMSIVDVFDDNDIQTLFRNRKVYWIAKEISRDSYQKFRDFLKVNLEFKTYTWRDVIRTLNAGFLEGKERSWFERLFLAIKSFAVTNEKNMGSHDIDVSAIPFVRLSTGKHICAYDHGKPTVYINNPDCCPNRIEASFVNNEIIRTFYANNLHVLTYNVERTVVDSILPKYATKGKVRVSTEDLRENIADLKIIKDAIWTNPKVSEDVRNYYILTDGKNWYRPTEIHMPSGYNGKTISEYRLVKGICNLRFFTMQYECEPKLDEKFFRSIGCAATLKRISIEKNVYLDMVRNYIGKAESEEIRWKILQKDYQHGINWDVMFEGFPEVFKQMDFKKSLDIARFLNRSTTFFQIRGEIAGANDQGFSGAHVDSMKIYSAIGLTLTFIPWIYSKEGVKVAVSEIHRREVDPEYERVARRFLDYLPFKEEDKAIEEILSRVEDPKNRETLKALLTDPEQLSEVSKALEKRRLKELKRENKSPEEVLKEMSRKAGKAAAKNEEEPEAVGNPERRRRKLEEEFGESMEFKLNVPKSTLKYTYQEGLSSEEKTFLQAQYNGFCQICDTTIVKYDGGHHFQAINVMRTSELDRKYNASLGLGWNSLCLCPNCAAKYRYGVKDVSDFYEQVKGQEVQAGDESYIKIRISLQDTEEEIRYTPKHFLALKTAMEYFAKTND